MGGLIRTPYRRARRFLSVHVISRAPWLRRLKGRPPVAAGPPPQAAPEPEPMPAPKPEPKPEPPPKPPAPARFSAMNVERLRNAGGEFPGSMPVTEHAEDLTALIEGRYRYVRFEDDVEEAPPPPGLVFAGVCNDKYVPGLEALILSLLRQYPGMDNTFVVFHDEGLSTFARHRLVALYPSFVFEERDPSNYAVTMSDGYNHSRVGLLGYLTLEVLGMEEPDWVVILDTDLLVLGDISRLWAGERLKAVPDAGHRPWAIEAVSTQRLVINSGVLAIPRSERGPEAVDRMNRVLASVDSVTDPAVYHYADQKFWNLYLAERDVELLPQMYNTIKLLMTRDYPDEIGSVRILHLTGPKPWYTFIDERLLTEEERDGRGRAHRHYPTAFALWDQIYKSAITRARIRQFRAEEGAALRELAGSCVGRPLVLIGNGPSLNDTDMTAFDGYEKVAFNWFVNHQDFDRIRPDHLVLPSHMLFGGWHTMRPELPATYVSALRAHEHRPMIWISFYFKHYIETSGVLDGYEVRYFLFEKPFKRRIGHAGWAPLDLRSPLVDSNTGVLTAGVPMALHMGASHIVLVGCDSNYASTAGSYFYDADSHDSRTTESGMLLRTWAEGGDGRFGYEVVATILKERGVPFLDATVAPGLPMLEHVTLDDVRAIAASGRVDTR